jgi:DNA-binding transcriptional MocR family regulator
MSASAIRALFAVASRPEVVSLAGGMPYLPALPLEAVSELFARLVAERGVTALQYGSGQGDPRLRELICDVMALEGISASADDVTVTVGSQQGLDLVTRLFCDPGDVVVAEAPSYVGALGTFASYEAEVVHVAMDDDGLIPAALSETVAALAAQGKRAKFLYTVPNFQNPAGVSLAEYRRTEILTICRDAGLLVVEDNPYGLLGFDGDAPTALRALDDAASVGEDDERPGGVIYLGSFSKTFAPGLRVGWVLAPHSVREKLVLANESAVLCPPTFNQMAVAEYLATQPWQEHVKGYREIYRERRDTMLDALEGAMPEGCTWTRPAGGFFLWLTLPDGLDSRALLPRAIQNRVAFVPGTGFYADGQGVANLRLSYCYPEPERIREGVRRLAAVCEEEVELIETFGPAAVRQARTSGPLSDTPTPGTA